MPKVSNFFRSVFFRPADLNGAPSIVVTFGAPYETTHFGKDVFAIPLVGLDTPLRLTGPLARDIVKILGVDEIYDFEGGTVELYTESIKVNDEKTGEPKEETQFRPRVAPGHKVLPPSVSIKDTFV
jgi:hypothetical protein